MSKEMVISSNRHETRVALLEDDQLVEVYFQRSNEYSLAGSIHKGRVTRVLPGMQSAFVDLGLERDTFLYVSDFLEEHEDIDKVTGDERPSARGSGIESGDRDRGRERRQALPTAERRRGPRDRSRAARPRIAPRRRNWRRIRRRSRGDCSRRPKPSRSRSRAAETAAEREVHAADRDERDRRGRRSPPPQSGPRLPGIEVRRSAGEETDAAEDAEAEPMADIAARGVGIRRATPS